MQNFKSSTTLVIELRFFMKKKKKMKMSIYLNSIPHVILSSNFLHAVIFFMFSTLISVEDRLRLKLKVKTFCMAIMLDHTWQSLYTQYYCTV